MAPTTTLVSRTIRCIRHRARTSLAAGLVAALILVGTWATNAGQTTDVGPERQAEAEAFLELTPRSRLGSGAFSVEQVRELLSVFEARLGTDDPLAARVVVAAASALHDREPRCGKDERLDLKQLAVTALLELGDMDTAARETYQLEALLREAGQFQRAARLLDRTLAVLPQSDALRPYLLLARAEGARHSGDVLTALSSLAEASNCLGDSGSVSILGYSIGGLRAQIHLDRGLTDLAAPLIADGISGLRELREQGNENPGALLAAYLRRANLRMALGRYDLMVVELDGVLKEIEQYEDPFGRVRRSSQQLELRLAVAQLYEGRGDAVMLDRARLTFAQILASETADAATRLRCASRLGQLGLAADDLDEAGRHLALARSTIEGDADAAANIPIKDRAFVSAMELHLSLLREDEAAASHSRLERLSAEIAELERVWQAQPARVGGLGLLRYDRTRSILGECIAGQAALYPGERGTELALQAAMRARAAGSLHRRLGAEVASLEQVRRALLPAGTGALVYFPFQDRAYVFSVDAIRVEMHELTSSRVMLRSARPWIAELMMSPAGLSEGERERRAKLLAHHGAKLTELLLPESVRARLQEWNAVHIVGSDLLEGVPIEALPLGSGELLGQAIAIGHLPSLSIGVHLAARARNLAKASADPNGTQLCLIAGVQSAASASARADLAFGHAECAPLVRPFDESRVSLRLGSDAKLELLVAQELPRACVLHFVTHGTYAPERERPFGLQLSGERALWCEDAERMTAPALVILSACAAGRGPQRWGDGPVSNLVGAFLIAGADAVVSSNADMAYGPTLKLMAEFQRELADGVPINEAMRRARKTLAGSPETRDPFYHGLIRVLGYSGQPVF